MRVRVSVTDDRVAVLGDGSAPLATDHLEIDAWGPSAELHPTGEHLKLAALLG